MYSKELSEESLAAVFERALHNLTQHMEKLENEGSVAGVRKNAQRRREKHNDGIGSESLTERVEEGDILWLSAEQ